VIMANISKPLSNPFLCAGVPFDPVRYGVMTQV